MKQQAEGILHLFYKIIRGGNFVFDCNLMTVFPLIKFLIGW